MEIILNVIGWVGTFLVLLGFYLSSNGMIKTNSTLYQSINLFGAIFVGVNVFNQKAWPAFVLQLIWGLIAVSSLIKNRNNKSTT